MGNKGNLTLREGRGAFAGAAFDPMGWMLRVVRGFTGGSTLYVALDPVHSFGEHCHTSDTIFGFPVHKTAIMLRVRLTNQGKAPLTVTGYSLAYKQSVKGEFFKSVAAALGLKALGRPLPLSLTGNNEVAESGENAATLPIQGADGSAFELGVGQTCAGTLYFEGKGDWHDATPRLHKGKMYARLNIALEGGDSLSRGFWVQAAPMGTGRALSADFGKVNPLLEAG